MVKPYTMYILLLDWARHTLVFSFSFLFSVLSVEGKKNAFGKSKSGMWAGIVIWFQTGKVIVDPKKRKKKLVQTK